MDYLLQTTKMAFISCPSERPLHNLYCSPSSTFFHSSFLTCAALSTFMASPRFVIVPKMNPLHSLVVSMQSDPPQTSSSPSSSTSSGSMTLKQKWNSFWKGVDDAIWDGFQGRKERIWTVDHRPMDQRGPFDYSKSTLLWGNYIDPGMDEYQRKIQQQKRPLSPTNAQIAQQQRRQQQQQQQQQQQDTQMAATEPVTTRFQPINPNALSESDLKSGDESWRNQLFIQAAFSDRPEDERERSITPRELAELCFNKYGKYHDMSILSQKPFGEDYRQVAFNIYAPCLGDPSFPYTEQQYLLKLAHTCDMLNAWDHAWYVKQFLRAEIVSRRGLPSTPRADTAVTLRLNTSGMWQYVPSELVNPWFGS